MARSFVAACLVFAGVWSLAGRGWALIAGACLVFALWPQGAETWLASAARRVTGLAAGLAARVRAAPRRATAMTGMTAAVVLMPAGFGFAMGVGAALISAAAGLAGVSLLTGWNA